MTNSESSARPTVLHCFGTYLGTTENWAFRLIRHVPGCRQLVAAHRFLDNDFYVPEIEYLRPPVQLGAMPRSALKRAWHLADSVHARFYPHYLAWRLRHQRIDIVHSHFANIGWRYRKLASALGALHAISFYGWDYEHLSTIRPEWKSRMSQMFAEADLLICEGRHGAATLARMGCPEHKIRVCRLGVEPDRIPVFRRKKQPGELRLLQIASFREKKGHLYSIRAFADASMNCPNSTLTLVGSGDATALKALRVTAIETGVENRVHFVPALDFAQLHEFMRGYHVFIHPSVHSALNDCEGGAPVVLLDAQATGMPVISTRHCDIPEEVVDGSTGLLSDERDVIGLSDAIRRFYLMDQTEYDGFADRARTHVSTHFESHTCSARLGALYAEAMQCRPSHPS